MASPNMDIAVRLGDETNGGPMFPNLWQACLIALAVPGVQLLEKGVVLAADALLHTAMQREPTTVLAASVISVPLVVLAANRFVSPPRPSLREKNGCLRALLVVLGCLAMAAGMALVSCVYFEWVGRFMPSLEAWNRFRGFATRQASNSEAWMLFALPPLILPVFEEWLFRGMVLRGLLREYRPILAVPMAAALFAVAHAGFGGASVAFLSSLIWGWWYVRTRSLGLCIMGHVAQNMVSVVLYAVFGEDPGALLLVRCALWGGGLLAAGFWLCRFSFRQRTESEE